MPRLRLQQVRLSESAALREVRELFLPRGLRCVYCGAPVGKSERCACERCREKLEPAEKRELPDIDELCSAYVYAPPLDEAVKSYKYDKKRYIARHMALELARLLPGGVLMPVPTHPRRVKERGFDHTAELARELSFLTGRRLLTGALVRAKYTPQQAMLTGAERKSNIEGAFSLTSLELPKAVVLIDDVISTGSTIRECAVTLRNAGVTRVSAATFAAAGRHQK